MDIELVKSLVVLKSGRPLLPQDGAMLDEYVDAEAHPDVREYFLHCLPSETYLASQVRVLPWEAVKRELIEGSAPGSFIRPFGYIIVATTVGGNVLCLQQRTGRVFWAGHDSFSNGLIMFQNRTTGNWEYLEQYSVENVERAMIFISENLESFWKTLLTDQLTGQLGALD